MLYFAPETVLPLASALMAAVGGFLLFFRRGTACTRAAWRRLFRRVPPSDPK